MPFEHLKRMLVLFLVLCMTQILLANKVPIFDLLKALDEEYNLEILLMSSHDSIDNYGLEDLFESFHLPIIHHNQYEHHHLLKEYDCENNDYPPGEIGFLSSLPWRERSKSLLTWLMPKNTSDMTNMLSFMER